MTRTVRSKRKRLFESFRDQKEFTNKWAVTGSHNIFIVIQTNKGYKCSCGGKILGGQMKHKCWHIIKVRQGKGEDFNQTITKMMLEVLEKSK